MGPLTAPPGSVPKPLRRSAGIPTRTPRSRSCWSSWAWSSRNVGDSRIAGGDVRSRATGPATRESFRKSRSETVPTPRALVLLVAALAAAVLLSAGGAAATAPVSVGKVVAPGAFGVPYGQGSFPGQSLFQDGDLVYDSQVSVEVVNANPSPISVSIVTEEWTSGVRTVYVNESGPNGTYSLVPEQVPVRENPVWSNSSLTVPGDSSQETSVPLPYTGSYRPLEVRVGNAVWELRTLTPVTSSLAGIYTSGGLDGVALTEAAVTVGVMLAYLAGARKLARTVHRTPRVSALWPVLWVGVPVALFLVDYVGTNQVLGAISPFVYPALIGAAAFPYLPRLWRDYELAEIQGVEGRNLEDATNAKIVLPLVRTRLGLRCAPETWREVIYVLLGAPLPEVRGHTVQLLGRRVQVQPRGLDVSCPLPAYYVSEADASYWYDTRTPPRRVRHRLEWWRSEMVPAVPSGPDGGEGSPARPRRRISPHIVPGYLEARFPPLRPVARELAGVRDAETEAHDNEVDRLMVADLLGTYRHLARELASDSLSAADEAYQSRSQPRSEEEIRRLVEARAKTRVPSERSEGPG